MVIFLNAGRFLEEAIQSVLAQTHAQWELLLVDDGSSDQSTDVARRYAAQQPQRIRYVEHEGHANRGMSASRNLGIGRSAGKYIAILDADDAWAPQTLAEQVAILEAQPRAAMVFGPMHLWHPEDPQRDRVQWLGMPADALVEPPGVVAAFLENEGAAPSGILVRRSAVEEVGGFDERFAGMYEDQVFRTKVCLRWPAYVSSHVWYKYRQHPDNCCAQAVRHHKHRSTRIAFLKWVRRYLAAEKMRDPTLRRLVRQQLWQWKHPTLHAWMMDLRCRIQSAKRRLKSGGRRVLPAAFSQRLADLWRGRPYCPPPGHVRLGHLRRCEPLSRCFGFDRGLPVDRYYIEKFLAERSADIQGRVLEIADDEYTRRFGADRVRVADVLYPTAGNPKATLVGDLACGDGLPGDAFDCIILTQTLSFIYDYKGALRSLHRMLRPGGVLLATTAGIAQISRVDMDQWGDYWRFTSLSARRLFEETFGTGQATIETCGNVLAATAFMQGMAAGELKHTELDHHDRDYELIITIRAVKGGA